MTHSHWMTSRTPFLSHVLSNVAARPSPADGALLSPPSVIHTINFPIYTHMLLLYYALMHYIQLLYIIINFL